ncbi:DegV family protein [Anaerocolumna xylanovorans]|uniref:EDD domain protein, DegV family n=1 Tax=Anaerocolumna xylanovorans DSM 12503 TaxID=1121345 RepID=A0A1M7XWZ0_9FIRM|nr:DegV family protein [Anaerocolumna xylanovorans]SHO43339.1 EDD domain protein, DegV family [Anaerocolumna xylanovorans DSM 12503]
MSDYIITCCSTADMAVEFFQENNIPLIHFHYTMEGKEYEDDLGKSMPFDMFYSKIKDGAASTTSQPNAEQYMEVWEPLLKEGYDVLHISLSSGISGAFNSACIARDMLGDKYTENKIYVVDSLAASSGFGLLVTLASEKKKEGYSVEECYNWLQENKLTIHHWFFSTDLTSYYRGGRISATSAAFGTILKICPLLNVSHEGKLIPRDKYRGKKKVSEEMVKRMEQYAKDRYDYSGRCYISQSSCYEDAKLVADMIEEKFPKLNGKVIINNIGTVIGSHTGPGTVALYFVGDKRTE